MDSVRLRHSQVLPEVLTNRDGALGTGIRVATEAYEASSSNHGELSKIVRDAAKAICPHYQPNPHDPMQVMCVSGMGSSLPIRGQTCATGGCMLSQVILQQDAFIFLGPQSKEDALAAKIFAPKVMPWP